MIRRRLPHALALLCLLVTLPAGPVAAGDGLSRHDGQSRHDAIVAHWTEARMRAAIPRDFVRTLDGSFRRAAKPAPGGGTVVGASWPNGAGLVYRATGKVYFEMAGVAYVCSGAVAQDTRADYSLVLTAAHCAYDEVADAFATNWLFIPQFDSAPTFTCASTAYGCWTATGLVVHDGYAARPEFDAEATYHDFAFAIVGAGGKSGGQLDATVGSFPVSFETLPARTPMSAFGYPAAGKYRGTDLTYCSGPVFYDPYNASRTYGMDCSMTGGSSGGPWFSSFDSGTGTGTLSSLNSYVYSGIRAMHGPWFNATTRAVFAGADAGTGNAIVQ